MPLYEYQCPQCGKFELIQKFSDTPLTACPRCASEVHKLPSAPAIQFKGTGWYITDYARKSSGGESGGAKSSEGKSSEGGAKSEGGDSSPAKDAKAPAPAPASKDSTAGGGTK